MRLLNVHTLELATFDSRTPPYAIASHRWDEGTESSFQDVQAKNNLDRAGYKKIEMFAAFVRDRLRALKYLWIDTCCIDKTNSQELQEAITAMYKWYEGADICLVYLNDVQDIYSTTNQIAVENLRRAIWFTRGWTLQELLAPRLVVFLSSAWEVLGHKAQDDDKAFTSSLDNVGPKLNRQIASITGIPEIIIAQPERRRLLTIDERMAWTSTRTTTRPEDMAYCLLGLFDVSMPLLYQEGSRAAQRRLMTAIAEANNENAVDLIIGDSSKVKKQFENRLLPSAPLPFLRDPGFVNRPEIGQMEQKLSIPGTRVALAGLGGVGKSQLALEYCYRLQERCPDMWVLWVHVGTAARYEQSLRKLAGDVGIPGHRDAKTDVFDMVYHWLRDVRNGKWLLVLDSADDAEFLFEPPGTTIDPTSHDEAAAFRRTRLDFLPICSHGSIILTSRYRAVAAKFTDEQSIISVLPMSSDDAVALFIGRTGHSHDTDALEQLITALDHMPLAISQAAAYIKRRWPRCSIEGYLEKLEKSSKSKAQLLSKASVELRRDPKAENSIILTWQISFSQVQALRRSAANLLSLISFFDHQSIPESLLRNYYQDRDASTKNVSEDDDGADKDHDDDNDVGENDSMDSSSLNSNDDKEAFEDDLAILQDYDFISATPTGKELKIHRLVQFASQIWLKFEGQYDRWVAQSIWNLDYIFPKGDYENWSQCEVLYPHARLMLDVSPKGHDACLRRSSILFKAARFAERKGSPMEAEKLVYACIQARERLGDSEGETTTLLTEFFAAILEDQGKYNEAEQVLRRTLARLNDETEDLHTSLILVRLASVLFSQGQYDIAAQMAQRALDGWDKVLGSKHPYTLGALTTLALALECQGKYGEAEQMERSVLAVREAALGSNHLDTLTSELRVARMLAAQSKYEEAERGLHRVLRRAEEELGSESRITLSILNYQSVVFGHLSRYEEAERVCHRALEGQEKVLGSAHFDTLTSVWSLAWLKGKQQMYDIAISLYERASVGFTETMGPVHLSTVRCCEQFNSIQEAIRQG